jgi:hypothetical protein
VKRVFRTHAVLLVLVVATLRKEISRLKRVLAEKVLEVDFFKGALHTVKARRQRNGQAGAQASTPRRRDISAQLISLLQIAVRHCTVA